MDFTDLKRDTVDKSYYLTLVASDTDYEFIKQTEFWTIMRLFNDNPPRSYNKFGEIPYEQTPTILLLSYNKGNWFSHLQCDNWFYKSSIRNDKAEIFTKMRNEVLETEKSNLIFGTLALTDVLGHDVCSLIRLF